MQKIVSADGFVLPFEDGELDRRLLLKAPVHKASHGDFLAEGALLVNFGLTELTDGITGLPGYRHLRDAGLGNAQISVSTTPYGMGLTMVF